MPYKDKAKQLESQRKCYHNNPQKYIKEAAVRKAAQIKWFQDLRNTLKCMKCPESREPCLEFHHRDPKEKDFGVSFMIHRFGKKRILEEIAKCDVLCRNCHAMEHWENGNFHGRKV